jgi:hypothetical protein
MIAFLVNGLWQPLLLAAAFVAVDAASRRAPANVRYWLAVTALGGAVAMPIVSAWPSAGGRVGGVVVAADISASAALLITTAYLVMVAIAAIRLARRWWLATRLTPDTISTPMTIGAFRPVILIPRFLTDTELVAAAVAHEQAHIRRRDYLMQLLTEIVALPLAAHPAIVLLRRRIGELREMACDEAAAADRDAYARALVTIASLATSHAPAGALAMASTPTSIERRIAALRSSPRRGAGVLAITTFAIASAMLFAFGCRNAAHPTVGADLSGNWALDRAASELGPLARYSAFRQTIVQHGNHIAVRQLRVTGRQVEHVAWAVTADGVERPVDSRGRGLARWQGDHLLLTMRGPQVEHGTVWIADGKLVIEGDASSAHYRAVFRRTK